MSAPVASASTALDRRDRLTVLAVCSMSLLIAGLDTTIVNVALPAIHRSLHASLSGLQWMVDGYSLAVASLMMLAGSTGDRIGRRRVFTAGIVLFTASSAMCATAQTAGMLVAARILQGVGGSMLNPVALAIIRTVFEEPRERAQAIGIWGALFGISMALGPVLGGAIVDGPGWRWVFLVNLPIGGLCFALTRRFVPESRNTRPRRLDLGGQVLVIAGLGTLVYAIIEGRTAGFTSAGILALFAVAAVTLCTLVVYELRRTEPLLEIRCFASAPFAGAVAIAVCAFAAFGGFLFLNTLYLQDVRHLSALRAGLYTLPLGAAYVLCSPLSGRLIAARGPRLPLLTAGAMLTISPLLLIGIEPRTHVWLLLVAYVAFGLGSGFVNPPITNAAVAGMPAAQSGVAGAIAASSRQVGTALGIAVLGAVAGAGATGAGSLLGAGGAARAGSAFGPRFATATHPAWWIVAALGLAVLMLGAAATSGWALRTASATAARLAPSGAGAT